MAKPIQCIEGFHTKAEVDALQARIAALEQQDRENQERIDRFVLDRGELVRGRARISELEAALRTLRKLWPIHLHDGMVRVLTVDDVKAITKIDEALTPDAGGA